MHWCRNGWGPLRNGSLGLLTVKCSMGFGTVYYDWVLGPCGFLFGVIGAYLFLIARV